MGYKLKNVYLVNKSTVVTNTELNKMALAIQKQVQEHFAPAWNITAYVKVVTDTSKIQPTSYNGIIYFVEKKKKKGLAYCIWLEKKDSNTTCLLTVMC